MSAKVFYSHGKLLLTAEYVVLDGAIALAIPTKKGQYLTVKPTNNNKIIWKSFDENTDIWFETEFNNTLTNTKITCKKHQTLLTILQAAKQLNSIFLTNNKGYLITTQLTFNTNFGLGSSSTLIANIAKWAKVNPFELLQQSFGGSGYDIACANSNSALTYQLVNNTPIVKYIDFNPRFSAQIFLIYLNQKQDSKLGITRYKKLNTTIKKQQIELINTITEKMINCTSLIDFNVLIDTHEKYISEIIETPTVKETLFKDYNCGSIKSLGAWGGDFILVTVKNITDLNYFKTKGYTTIFSLNNMML